MKPILFNTEMVREILDGRKTVTRRVVKPQPDEDGLEIFVFLGVGVDTNMKKYNAPCCLSDILWVRETWAKDRDGEFVYRTDYGTTEDDSFPPSMFKWRPSIHMPREAARIFLRVTDVRVERLQEITEDGAKAEGAVKSYPYTDPETGKTAFMLDEKGTYRSGFLKIWDNTVPKHQSKFKRYPYYWADNPWVWVIEFEKISKEEARKG